MIGAISDLTAFSFYATKTLSTGEGGMLTTANEQYAQHAALMSLHGISRDAWKRYSKEGSWFYEVLQAGYKYNMTDLAASIGIHQLARSEELLARRRTIAQRYTNAFSAVARSGNTSRSSTYCEHAWHLYILRLRLERLTIDRDACIQALTASKYWDECPFYSASPASFLSHYL